MTPLSASRRSELRAQAHKLDPVVIIGDKGLTDEVIAEVDRSLKAHELIKVRAATDDRIAREQWMKEICERLEAHAVQRIGKMLVIYRENFDKPRSAPVVPGSSPRGRGVRDDRSGPRDAKGVTRTARRRSRTTSRPPASAPRRRRPRTSR